MSATSIESLKRSHEPQKHQPYLLDESFTDLQDQVESLTQELKIARLARHREFIERERLGKRMTCALDALPGAALILDGGGIIREKNCKARKLLSQPLLGRPWSEVARREFHTSNVTDGDLRSRDGRRFHLSRQPLGSEPGEILLLADVSESRRMSELMQRQERLSTMGEMTASLAHQIRTPLTSALLYVGQFGGGLQNEKRLAVKVSDRLHDMVRMVDDMLIYAGGARRSGDKFFVTELFEDILESVEQCADSHPLKIASLRNEIIVEGNRDAIQGVLINLVDNARQACGDTAKIELGAELLGDRVCLTVSDNGPGIPEDISAQIFEPFFTTRPEGTGLGLSVARAVADAHKGEILVDSTERGTTFALCLPVIGEI